MVVKLKKTLIIFGIFTAILFVLGAGIFFAGCGHQHTFGEWNIINEATCEEDGQKERTCDECGFTETVIIKAKGHDKVVKERIEPTCSHPGLTEGEYCQTCNKIFKEQKPIEQLKHNMSNWQVIEIPDEEKQCSGARHERHCLNNGCDEREEDSCTYGEKDIVVQPTCRADGYTIHVCSVCGDSFKHDVKEKIPHKFGNVWVPLGQDEEGHYIHTRICEYEGCGQQEEPQQCNFDEGVETSKQTCTTKETKLFTCETCKQFYSKDIKDELGHLYPDAWTQGEDDDWHHTKTCTRSDCGHVWTELCGKTTQTTMETCTTDRQDLTSCSVCGRSETKTYEHTMLGHAWTQPIHVEGTVGQESQHKYHCSRCEIPEITENCQEFYTNEESDATCEADGIGYNYCSKCTYSYDYQNGTALGHIYKDNWEQIEEDGVHYHIRYCERNPEHFEKVECSTKYRKEQTATPDCDTAGQYTLTCTVCGFVDYEEIPALGHTWARKGQDFDDWIITESNHTRTCTVCGESETKPHSYDENETNFCDYCGHDGLIYETRDGYAVVVSDNNVVNYAKTITIAEFYEAEPVTEIVSGLSYNTIYGSGGFYNNKVLETLYLPYTLRTISNYAFSNCLNLKSVSVKTTDENPSNLIKIGNWAFENCKELLTAIFPEGLQTIGNYSFSSCTKLDEIYIPDSVVDIGDHAFKGTKFFQNEINWTVDGALYINHHLIGTKPHLLNSRYEVLDETLTITAEAFIDCTQLTEIILPGTLVEVGRDAFKNCSSLDYVTFNGTLAQWVAIKFANDAASPMHIATHIQITGSEGVVEIPNDPSVTSIPAGAFKNTQITGVKIHSNIVSIGEEAFENCNLTTFEIDEDCKLDYVGLNAFKGSSLMNKESELYNQFWQDGVMYVGHCIVATDSTDISEDFEIPEEKEVVSIAVGAFLNNLKIKSIIISSTVDYIGDNAFAGCKNLVKAKFNDPKKWFAFNSGGAGRGVDEAIIGNLGKYNEDGSKVDNWDEVVEYQSKQTAYFLNTYNVGYWKKSIVFNYD